MLTLPWPVEAPMLELRASGGPIWDKCAAAARTQLKINTSGDDAVLGTAAHATLAQVVLGEQPDFDAVAAEHKVPLDDLRILTFQGRKIWYEVVDAFPNAVVEREFRFETPEFLLTGHTDVVSIDGTHASVLDWKTGRADSDYGPQMRAYAGLIMHEFPAVTDVSATVAWVRDQEIETIYMDLAGYQAWLEGLERVVRWDGTYRPGSHCLYCPRSHECEARTAMARRDVGALVETGGEVSLAAMKPAEILALHERVRQVSTYAARVQDLLRKYVSEHGPVDTGYARLSMQEEKHRVLDTTKAVKALMDHGFTLEEVLEAAEVKARVVDEIAKSKVRRGQGAAAIRAVNAALADAGAVSYRVDSKLVARRV